MKATIKKGKLVGTVYAPPSKSYAHRLMICSALADGESIVSGISESEDMLATLDCIKSLGVHCKLSDDVLTISGKNNKTSAVFPCRESGSTMRFFIPIALTKQNTVCFTGSSRLIERGIEIYENALDYVSFEKYSDKITINGTLRAGDYKLRGNVSSQYISGLLLALPMLNESSTLEIIPPVESRSYIDITIDAMKQFGVIIEETKKNTFYIKGKQKYHNQQICVEGDWSNAAFFYAFNALGHNIEIKNLNNESIQGDKVCVDLLKQLDGENPVIDISDCPDLGPVLFAVAAAKNGAVFNGTKRLRIKECDRASAMAEELGKFGINVVVEENSVTVCGGNLQVPADSLDGHNDHRIVMALSVLLALTGGTIDGVQAVSKSYPDYFNELEKLGAEVIYE